MSALAKHESRDFIADTQARFNRLPAKASAVLWIGGALMLTAGYVEPLAGALKDFAGFAKEGADMTGKSSGDDTVLVRAEGRIMLDVTGVTGVGDVGSWVYATTDNDFTLTSTSATRIGKIIRWDSGTLVEVLFRATPLAGGAQPGAALAALTDSSAGAAVDGTIEAMANPTDSPATADALRDDIVANLLPAIRNNFKELTNRLNAVTLQLQASGITL